MKNSYPRAPGSLQSYIVREISDDTLYAYGGPPDCLVSPRERVTFGSMRYRLLVGLRRLLSHDKYACSRMDRTWGYR
jgi:hypothetical protein